MDAVFPPVAVSHRNHVRTNILWLVPCLFVVASSLSLFIDVPFAVICKSKLLPKAIDSTMREWLEICESFGHGFGAAVIILAVGILDPGKWRCVPWMFAGSLGSGMIANTIKLMVHRTRPREFTDLAATTVWDTFAKATSGSMGTQSFPSSHTATAVGLAVMLTALYPQGRWYFATLAALVGMQRIVASCHFPSDVFAGAAVGWVVGFAVADMMLRGTSWNAK